MSDPHTIDIPARILNETDTGYLVTQRPLGGRGGVWLDKDAVTVRDRNAVLTFHTITLPAELAVRKGLNTQMQESRPAPSPYGGQP